MAPPTAFPTATPETIPKPACMRHGSTVQISSLPLSPGVTPMPPASSIYRRPNHPLNKPWHRLAIVYLVFIFLRNLVLCLGQPVIITLVLWWMTVPFWPVKAVGSARVWPQKLPLAFAGRFAASAENGP